MGYKKPYPSFVAYPRIEFNMSAATPVNHPEEPFVEAFGGWQERSILIVDDEPGMRSFLQRTLVGRCSRVDTVDSVEAANVLLGQYHFDLIIPVSYTHLTLPTILLV